MELSKEDEGILKGAQGEGKKRAMELLVALGEINDAQRLIPITSAQVSGVSYKTIGDHGLNFLSEWASSGVKVTAKTTLNPAGVDTDIADELGYSRDFIQKQGQIIDTYRSMGILPSCTCTPYLAGNLPKFGESIAWAESSSAIFANSVIGARTNVESGVSALASAIIGKTPFYGLHLEENRKPTFEVTVDASPSDLSDYAAMGYVIGQEHDGIPIFRGINPTQDGMKIMGAALATGSIPMFHVEGGTPECKGAGKLKKIEFGKKDLKGAYELLNTTLDPDIICIGCPHCSVSEAMDVIKRDPKREVWIFTARQNKEFLEGHAKGKNVRIICDTCMVVSPLEELGIRSVGVNSAKAAFYCRNLSGLDVMFDSVEKLIK